MAPQENKAYPEFGGLTGGEITVRLQVLDNLLNSELDTAFVKDGWEHTAPSADPGPNVQVAAAGAQNASPVPKDFWVIAHRGWSGSYPENTLIGMREAIKLGCQMIEFDVTLTADRKLIIIHDNILSRTTNGCGLVNEWNYKDLRQLDAGSWFHPKYAGTRLPSLDELLLIARDTSIHLNIEIKKECWDSELQDDGVERQVIAAVRRYGVVDRVLVSSFRWDFIDRFQLLDPGIRTALLHYKDVGRLNPAYLKERYGITAINPHAIELTQKFVDRCHAADLKVFPFTINGYEDMEKYLGMHVDGMFTNHPNRLFRFLEHHRSRHAELKDRERVEDVQDLNNAIKKLELEELEKARKRARWRARRLVLTAARSAAGAATQ